MSAPKNRRVEIGVEFVADEIELAQQKRASEYGGNKETDSQGSRDGDRASAQRAYGIDTGEHGHDQDK